MVWSYPRGGDLSKEGETAVDICAYAAHMACLLGAHIIKVKPPTEALELDAAAKVYRDREIRVDTLAARTAHVVQSCFNGRRMVVFSGGEARDTEGLLNEIRQLRDGGATGSIVGRNAFQRPREEALELLGRIVDIYLGKAMSEIAPDSAAAIESWHAHVYFDQATKTRAWDLKQRVGEAFGDRVTVRALP